MDEKLVATFEMLVERLSSVELTLGAIRETGKHWQERMPIGSVLCGALYRPGSAAGDLTIVKNYEGALTDHHVFAVTFEDTLPTWWQPSEWAGGRLRTWVDDAVEAVIGVDRAEAIRGRCLALMKDVSDPDNLVISCASVDAGLRGTTDIHIWWLRTAVTHKIPEVKDLLGDYVILQLGDDPSEGCIQTVVSIVDRIFDLCDETRPLAIDIQEIDSSLTDLAAAQYVCHPPSDQQLKELWDGMTYHRREDVKEIADEWRNRRSRMNRAQLLVDDATNKVHFASLMKLVATPS